MSVYLWKYYLQDDSDNFRRVLAAANRSGSAHSRGHGVGGHGGPVIESPGQVLASSPNLQSKRRGQSERQVGTRGNRVLGNINLTRAEVNSKDKYGVTLLHLMASSAAANASSYALAFLETPLLDLYIQDLESGWTALHRALYFGNVSIARALIDRDTRDATGHTSITGIHNVTGLIKIKDREGNSPFDVFNATVTNRILRHGNDQFTIDAGHDEEEDEAAHGDRVDEDNDGRGNRATALRTCSDGDELYTFGSNKNFTLGFGDEDDRQFPERITLKRPEHLLRRLLAEHKSQSNFSSQVNRSIQESSEIHGTDCTPALVQYRPIKILDVQLSKFHTAVLTTDPEANLYVCGFGPGGRLGTGDQTTRFAFTCIYGGGLMNKKIVNVGLGQNHTVAVCSQGEVFSWGNNALGQLGYSLPTTSSKDQDPLQLLPRQIFGPLKREIVLGTAASRTHSVVYTSTSLYTFGKNDGQLGLVDADARSLELQVTPRKVAASLFSSSISMVSAIDKATICLLENRDVWVFANYGWKKVTFALDGFSNYFLKSSYFSKRYDNSPNHIVKISSGGDTICALARSGDVFTVTLSQNPESSLNTTSTTNPAKIRGALSTPQRVWSLRKSHMAVRDVDVGQDGSVIICTESGSVWKRLQRAKVKDANAAPGTLEYRPKDYKFSRIGGLTRITAVRSNIYGAFAAVRKDTDVLKTQVEICNSTLWTSLFPLLSFHALSREEDSDTEEPVLRYWKPKAPANDPATIRHAVLTSKSLEKDIETLFRDDRDSESSNYDIKVGTTVSEVRIPCHEFLLAGRSSILRRSLSFRQTYCFSLSEVFTVEYDKHGNTLILFQGLDFITILSFVFYSYTDSILDVWHHTRQAPEFAFRYRQVRTELMKLAAHLEMRGLEQAARLMSSPSRDLHRDMELAIMEPEYFQTGDVEVELDGSSIKVHSALMCQRCPFFEGLFHGRAGGIWLSSRRETIQEPQEAIKVDMKHVGFPVFQMVLRHIYADTGEELFDDVVAADLDAFLDLVMEVLSAANELMLDRLAQVCQKMLGRFVDNRNVCQLLNAVAPCSVTEFKDAALEYICLNLEGMLENHLLNELDDDLMLELDEVVRQNQLACLPFAKSGRAEAELHERRPELAALLDRGKRIKVDSMAIQSRLHEDEVRFSLSGKSKVASAGDVRRSSNTEHPRPDSSRSDSARINSPLLRARPSAHDLMFDMDEDANIDSSRTAPSDRASNHYISLEQLRYDSRDPRRPTSSLPQEETWFDSRGKPLSPPALPIETGSFKDLNGAGSAGQDRAHSTPLRPTGAGATQSSNDRAPWKTTSFDPPKLDLRDIMAQTPSQTPSLIASGLSKRAGNTELIKVGAGPKLSQKERKKQLQQQQVSQGFAPASPEFPPFGSIPNKEKPASPWRTASASPRINLKDVLNDGNDTTPEQSNTTERTPSKPPLTLRQTVPGNAAPAKRAISDPRPVPPISQHHGASSPIIPQPHQSPSLGPSPQLQKAHPIATSSHTPPTPIKSIRHIPTPLDPEPSLQLSMADILSQQQTEKDIIKEAVAKRSLQEIQDEQAFQEWWDKEEAATRAQLAEAEAEAEVAARGRGARTVRGGRARGKAARGASRGKGRGRGGEGSGGVAVGGAEGGSIAESAAGPTAGPAGARHGAGEQGLGKTGAEGLD